MKILNKFIMVLFVLFIGVTLTACDEEEKPVDDKRPIVVKLDKTSLSLVEGSSSSTRLLATVEGLDDIPEWTSSLPTVATVKRDSVDPKSATVSAVGVGITIVTMKVGAHSAICTVTVTEADYLRITNEETISIRKDATHQISHETNMTGTVAYATEDAKVAVVSNSGLISGIDPGNTRISLKLGSKTIYVSVTVEAPGIGIKEKDDVILNLEDKTSATLTAIGLGGVDITGGVWTIEDNTVAIISQNGAEVTITALETGLYRYTIVTFSYGDYESVSRRVYVKDIDLNLTLTVDKEFVSLSYYLDSVTVTATIEPEQTGDKAVIDWLPDIEGVILISDSGEITRDPDYVFTDTSVTVKLIVRSHVDPMAEKLVTVLVESEAAKYKTISTAQEFVDVMTDPSSAYAQIDLRADIDLGGQTFGTVVPGVEETLIDGPNGAIDAITGLRAYNGSHFSGVFDGHGYTISNFSATRMFPDLLGTVKNVEIIGNMVGSGDIHSGFLCARVFQSGLVENVSIDVVFNPGLHWVSAIGLFNAGTARNVIVKTTNNSGAVADQVYAGFVQPTPAWNIKPVSSETYYYNIAGSMMAGMFTQRTSSTISYNGSNYNNASWNSGAWSFENGKVPKLVKGFGLE